MYLRRTLHSSAHCHTILKHQTPSTFPRNHQHSFSTHLSSFLQLQETASSLKSPTPILFFQRSLSSSSSKHVSKDQIEMVEMKKGEFPIDSKLQEMEELRMKSHVVSTAKPDEKNLSEVKKSLVLKKEQDFSYGKSKSMMRELSPEMVMLVSCWYEEGYLNKANFEPTKECDLKSFTNQYSRDFLTFTAEKFGLDHQEIAKWLSGTDMKTVALFGCPSVEKRSVFAAKRLRTFFSVQEDIVCRSCKLRSSCKYVNKRVWRKMDNLNLADAMKVLVSYSLDWTTQFALPKEVKDSINKLLKEVINLSQ